MVRSIIIITLYILSFICLVIKDFSDPEQLLSPENVDPEALQLFTMQAVVFATDNRLPDLQFARNHRGEPDVALFDFTTMYASENACRVIERKGHKLLTSLVGDSLLEVSPWETNTGKDWSISFPFILVILPRSYAVLMKRISLLNCFISSLFGPLGQDWHEAFSELSMRLG